MEDEEIQMMANGESYTINASEVEDFKKDFPDAKEASKVSYEAEGESYDLYENEVDDFKKDFPEAKEVSVEAPKENVKKKEDTGSTSEVGSSDSQETVDPIEQQRLAEVEGKKPEDKFNPITGQFAPSAKPKIVEGNPALSEDQKKVVADVAGTKKASKDLTKLDYAANSIKFDMESKVNMFEQAGFSDITETIDAKQKELEGADAALEASKNSVSMDFGPDSAAREIRSLERENDRTKERVAKEIKDLKFEKSKIILDYELQKRGGKVYDLHSQITEERKAIQDQDTDSTLDWVGESIADMSSILTKGVYGGIAEISTSEKNLKKASLEAKTLEMKNLLKKDSANISTEFKEYQGTAKLAMSNEIQSYKDGIDELKLQVQNGEITPEEYNEKAQLATQVIEGYAKELDAQVKNKAESLAVRAKSSGVLLDNMNSVEVANSQVNMGSIEAGIKSATNRVTGLTRAVASIPSAASSVYDLGASYTPLGLIMQEVTNKTSDELTADYIKHISEPAYQAGAKLAKDLSINVNDKKTETAQFVGDTFGQLAVTTVSSIAAGPMGGVAVSYIQMYDEMHNSLREEGIGPLQAANMANIYAAIASPLEYYGASTGIDAVLQKGIKNKLMSEFTQKAMAGEIDDVVRSTFASSVVGSYIKAGAKTAGKAILVEGTEEGVTEGLQFMENEGVRRYNNFLYNNKAKVLTGKMYFDTLVENAWGGAAAGMLMGGGTTAFSYLANPNMASEDVNQQAVSQLSDPKFAKQLRTLINDTDSMTSDEKVDRLKLVNDLEKISNQIESSDIASSKKPYVTNLLLVKKDIEDVMKSKDASLNEKNKARVEEIDAAIKVIMDGGSIEDSQKAFSSGPTNDPAPVLVEEDNTPIDYNYDSKTDDVAVPAPAEEVPSVDTATQVAGGLAKESTLTTKTQSVIDRADKGEAINQDEISQAEDNLISAIEDIENNPDLSEAQKTAMTEVIENEYDKLSNYDNKTETKTGTFGSKAEAGRVRKTKQKDTRESISGTKGEHNGEVGSYDTNKQGDLVFKGEDGTSKVVDVPNLTSPKITYDENGDLESLEVTDETRGETFTINDPEAAMDVAIEIRAREVGTVPDALFDETITEYETEVPVAKKENKGQEKSTKAKSKKPVKPAPKKTPPTAKELSDANKVQALRDEQDEYMAEGNMEGVDDVQKLIDALEKTNLEERKAGRITQTESEIEDLEGSKAIREDEGSIMDVESIQKRIDELKDGKGSPTRSTKQTKFDAIAENARRAIERILPNTKILVHKNAKEFAEATGISIEQASNSGGAFDTKNKTIHVNAENAKDSTIAHEVFHAILDSMGDSKEISGAIIGTVKSALAGKYSEFSPKEIRDLNEFTQRYKKKDGYDDQDRAEEFLSELLGTMTSSGRTLSSQKLGTVRKILKRILNAIGISGAYANNLTKDQASVIKTLNSISDALIEGRAIDTVKGLAPTEELKNIARENKKFKPQYISNESGIIKSYDISGSTLLDAVKNKLLTLNRGILDFKNNVMLMHQPDGAFGGTVRDTDGAELMKGSGGIAFPLIAKEGKVWASTKTGADPLAKHINYLIDTYGVAYIGITSAPVQKTLSSTMGTRNFTSILNSFATKNKYPLTESQLKEALIYGVEASQSFASKKSSSKSKKRTGIEASQLEGKNLQEVLDILDPLFNSEFSTFSERTTFSNKVANSISSQSKSILSDAVKTTNRLRRKKTETTSSFSIRKKKVLKEAKQKQNELVEMFSSITEGVLPHPSRDKQGDFGAISSKFISNSIAEAQTEPIVLHTNKLTGDNRANEDFAAGQLYAVIEVNSKVKVVKDDFHDSYPSAVATVDGTSPVVHILTDRVAWDDVSVAERDTFDPKTKAPKLKKGERYDTKKDYERSIMAYPTSGVSTIPFVISPKENVKPTKIKYNANQRSKDLVIYSREDSEANTGLKPKSQTSRFKNQIVGESARLSQDVRDNLSVATSMEKAEKTAKEIKIATGWERGADGKWKYEVADPKITLSSTGWSKSTSWKLPATINKIPLKNALLQRVASALAGASKKESISVAKYWLDQIHNDSDTANKFRERDQVSALSILEMTAQGVPLNVTDGVDNNTDIFKAKYSDVFSVEILRMYPQLKDKTLEIEVRSAESDRSAVKGKLGQAGIATEEGIEIYRNRGVKSFDEFLKHSDSQAKIFSFIYHELQHNIQEIEGFAIGTNPGMAGSIEAYEMAAGETEARNVQARVVLSETEKRNTLLAETEDINRDDQQVFFKHQLVGSKSEIAKNTQPSVDDITSLGKEFDGGATFNLDGTTYDNGGLVIPVGSINTIQSKLSGSQIASFTHQNKENISDDTFKIGLYKFKDSNQVSIDLSIVAKSETVDAAREFGRMSGQESLFSLDTFLPDFTDANGQNTVEFSSKQMEVVALDLAKGKVPSVFNNLRKDGKATISPENSENFANLTLDEERNFVFYHRSEQLRTSISPGKYGSSRTSSVETAALGKVGGVSMFYTRQEDGESMVNGSQRHMIKIPYEQVYDFNADPNNYIAIAKARHSKQFPKAGFDANSQLAFVTQVAAENGYKITVSAWGDGRTRGNSTVELAVQDVEVLDGTVVDVPFAKKYESNTERGWKSTPAIMRSESLSTLFNKMNKEIGDNYSDAAYRLYEQGNSIGERFSPYATQEDVDNAVNNSPNISQELKDEYAEVMKLPAVNKGTSSFAPNIKLQKTEPAESAPTQSTETTLRQSDVDVAQNEVWVADQKAGIEMINKRMWNKVSHPRWGHVFQGKEKSHPYFDREAMQDVLDYYDIEIVTNQHFKRFPSELEKLEAVPFYRGTNMRSDQFDNEQGGRFEFQDEKFSDSQSGFREYGYFFSTIPLVADVYARKGFELDEGSTNQYYMKPPKKTGNIDWFGKWNDKPIVSSLRGLPEVMDKFSYKSGEKISIQDIQERAFGDFGYDAIYIENINELGDDYRGMANTLTVKYSEGKKLIKQVTPEAGHIKFQATDNSTEDTILNAGYEAVDAAISLGATARDIYYFGVEAMKNSPEWSSLTAKEQRDLIRTFKATTKNTIDVNKAYNKGVKEGKKDQKAEDKIKLDQIKAAKQDVINELRAGKAYGNKAVAMVDKILKDLNTEGNPITFGEMKRALTRLKKAGKESVREAMDLVDKIEERIKNKMLKELLKKTKKFATDKKTTSGMSRPNSTDPLGQIFFSEFNRILKAHLEGDLETISSIEEQVAVESDELDEALLKSSMGEELTRREMELISQQYALELTSQVEGMEIEEVADMVNQINAIKKFSYQSLRLARQKRADENQMLRDEADQAMEEDHPRFLFGENGELKTGNEHDAELNVKYGKKIGTFSYFTKLKHKWDTKPLSPGMLKSMWNIDTYVDLLSPVSNIFRKRIYEPLALMSENSQKGYWRQTDAVDQLVKDNVPGVSNMLELTKKMGNKMIKLNLANGKKSSLTHGSAMRVIALSLNPQQMARLEKEGYDLDVIEDIKTQLGVGVADFVESVVDYLSTDYYDTVNSVHRKVNYSNLPKVDNYFPTSTEAYYKDAKVTGDGFMADFNTQYQSALKARTDTKAPLRINDGYIDFGSVLDTHFKDMEHFKAYAEGVKNINSTMRSDAVKSLLEQTGTSIHFNGAINRAVNPRVNATPELNAKIDRLYSNAVGYALSFKPWQTIKQATSAITALEKYNSGNIFKDFAKFNWDYSKLLVNPVKSLNRMRELSGEFRTRWDRASLVEIYGGASVGQGAKLNKVQRIASVFTKVGDMLGVMGYLAAYDRIIKEGGTEAEALAAFTDYNTTQQSTRAMDKNAIQANANVFSRGVISFLSSPILMLNKTYRHANNIKSGLKRGNKVKRRDVIGFILNLGFANAGFQFVSYLFKLMGDDEEEKEVMLAVAKGMSGVSALSAVPFIGPMIDDTYDAVTTGKKPRFDSSTINPFEKMSKSVAKLSTEDSGAQEQIQVGLDAIGLMFGLNFTPAKNLYDYFEDGKTSDALKALGVAKSYLPEEKEGKAGSVFGTQAISKKKDSKLFGKQNSSTKKKLFN